MIKHDTLGGAGFMVGPMAYRAIPSAGGDASFSDVAFLLGYEGADGSATFTDESSAGRTFTPAGTAQIDTAQSKFGSASGFFDGANSNITTPHSADLNPGAGSWTFETFLMFNNAGGTRTFFEKNDVVGGDRMLRLGYNSSLGLMIERSSDGTTGSPIYKTWSGGASVLTWYHICFEYDAATTSLRAYVDGVMQGTATVGAFTLHDTSSPLVLGTTLGGANDFHGWLDETRFTVGTARYASDGGFTVPAEAYPRSA